MTEVNCNIIEKTYKKVYKPKPILDIGGKNAWFMADNHHRHGNIIRYTGRPFLPKKEWDKLQLIPKRSGNGWSRDDTKDIEVSLESINLMDNTIINNINTICKKKDYLFILGDFGFFNNADQLIEYRNRINCQNIFFVWGNHDEIPLFKEAQAKANIFTHMIDEGYIRIHGQDIWLNHYCQLSWMGSHRGSWHLWGHCHGNLNEFIQKYCPQSRSLDVGVDCHNYKPISFLQIKEIMDKKGGQTV